MPLEKLAFSRYTDRLSVTSPRAHTVIGNIADQQVAAIADPHRPLGPAQTGSHPFDTGVEQAKPSRKLSSRL
ncbi:hypothetical protein Ddc_22700 [Ditylenchus destructor]|nr:hypothetical protein Ddc_22700 [Ditylenchus destructor]